MSLFDDLLTEMENTGLLGSTQPIVETIGPVLNARLTEEFAAVDCPPINWLANSTSQFDKVEYLFGTMQSNQDHELTYDLRVIAHSMVGELGINQLGQMTDQQLYACYRVFFQCLDRKMDHKLATRGARFAIVHNATTNRNERLYGNGQIALPYVRRHANNCVVIVFGKQTIAFHVNGEYMVK